MLLRNALISVETAKIDHCRAILRQRTLTVEVIRAMYAAIRESQARIISMTATPDRTASRTL